MLINDDCLIALKSLPDNSVDSLVTDPPAGISFMGKDWDKDKGGRDQWIAWMTEVMQECLRVMKPGAHGLVWAIPRTSHWTATALENAGFEVRDVVTHLFGSGFPKSLDISKAIDKAAGKERTEVIGQKHCGLHHRGGSNSFTDDNWKAENRDGDYVNITAPATPEAKQWQGFGTALKPASEHWILVRKPCSEKTVAANVLKHGCGGINIDGCRIGISSDDPNHRKPSVEWQNADNPNVTHFGSGGRPIENLNTQGRFPANLLLSHTLFCDDECDDSCPVRLLDEQSGVSKGGNRGQQIKRFRGASRFFYVAKASKRERGEGNSHPTVKPQKLMQYLITLITPPNGTVLDPFAGSGSTLVAAKALGFKFIGIEREKEYFDIATRRVG